MTKSKIGQVVSYIVILLVIVAVIGVFAYFTNGFTSDFKTFYVSVNGKDVMTTTGGYVLSQDKPTTVDIKYTFAFANNQNKGYSVKVVPNKSNGEDFTYTVDGQTQSFYDVADLSQGFDIVKGDKSFEIKPKGDTLSKVLQAVHGKEIGDCENGGYEDMFSLVITSYNEEASITLNFSIPGTVTGVKLNMTTIIF